MQIRAKSMSFSGFQRHLAVQLCFDTSKYINTKIVKIVETAWFAKFWPHMWRNGEIVVTHRFLISYILTTPLFATVSGFSPYLLTPFCHPALA